MTEEQEPARSSAYIWFDAEFTSLDERQAHLLQVAMIITDRTLRRMLPPEADVNVVVRLPETAVPSPWVQEHLGELVERARSREAMPVEYVDALLVSRIEEALGPGPREIKERPVLAGNSIHADRAVIRKHLPLLEDSLHYRMLDVSSWKLGWLDHYGQESFDKEQPELVRKFGLDPGPPLGGKAHDAAYDIHASIAEYRYYLRHLRCAPGSS